MDIKISCSKCEEIVAVDNVVIDGNGYTELQLACGHWAYISLDLLAPVFTGNPFLTERISPDKRLKLTRVVRD